VTRIVGDILSPRYQALEPPSFQTKRENLRILNELEDGDDEKKEANNLGLQMICTIQKLSIFAAFEQMRRHNYVVK
jgi:hypothetical protein